MNRRKRIHTQKTAVEKKYYNDYIRGRDYSPTVDESLSFEETTDKDSEFKVAENQNRRGKPLKEQVSEHFHEYWLHYLATGLSIVFIFLMVDSKVNFARLFDKTDRIEVNIVELKTSIKEVELVQQQNFDKVKDDLHKQNLELRENKLRVDNLERKEK